MTVELPGVSLRPCCAHHAAEKTRGSECPPTTSGTAEATTASPPSKVTGTTTVARVAPSVGVVTRALSGMASFWSVDFGSQVVRSLGPARHRPHEVTQTVEVAHDERVVQRVAHGDALGSTNHGARDVQRRGLATLAGHEELIGDHDVLGKAIDLVLEA